jgi:hypothetical protein
MVTLEQNYPHVDRVVLQLLSKNQAFKPQFELFAPEVYAEIQTFVTNPNCSCKSKIAEYSRSNSEKCINFVNNFLSETNSSVDFDEINNNLTQQPAVPPVLRNSHGGPGRVKRIKKSEWEKFPIENQSSFGGPIRFFSVVQVDEENIDVYYI